MSLESSYKSTVKGVRVTPRKARLVIDLIRGKHVQDALDTLQLTNKKVSIVVTKLLRSAIANASKGSTVDIDNLFVDEAFVNPGQVLKRFMPRAKGSASPILKRTSHITVTLKELL